MHPDDVVASGEGFNAWLIRVTDGYVNVDRLATVASMIPVLNNLMALADALTDIVSIIRKRGGELLDYLGLAINLIGVIPFPPVLAPMRLTARPLLALIRNQLLIHKRDIGAAVVSIVVTHVQASFSTEVEDFLTKLQAVVNDLIDHCAAKAQEIFTGLADGIDAVVAGKLFDPTKNERQAAEYRQLMKKSGWLSKDLVKGRGVICPSPVALGKRNVNSAGSTAASRSRGVRRADSLACGVVAHVGAGGGRQDQRTEGQRRRQADVAAAEADQCTAAQA